MAAGVVTDMIYKYMKYNQKEDRKAGIYGGDIIQNLVTGVSPDQSVLDLLQVAGKLPQSEGAALSAGVDMLSSSIQSMLASQISEASAGNEILAATTNPSSVLDSDVLKSAALKQPQEVYEFAARLAGISPTESANSSNVLSLIERLALDSKGVEMKTSDLLIKCLSFASIDPEAVLPLISSAVGGEVASLMQSFAMNAVKDYVPMELLSNGLGGLSALTGAVGGSANLSRVGVATKDDFVNKTQLAMRSISYGSTAPPGFGDKSINGFVNNFADTDKLFDMIIKSIVAKVFSSVGVYNILRDPSLLKSNISPLRVILGGKSGGCGCAVGGCGPECNCASGGSCCGAMGGKVGGGSDTSIQPEIIELYPRLTFLAEWYRNQFSFRRSDLTEGFTISLLPTFDGAWPEFIRVMFIETEYIKDGGYSDSDIRKIVGALNNAYKYFKSKKPSITNEEIVQDFILEVNKRYGIVKRSVINDLLSDNKALTIESEESMYPSYSRTDYGILDGDEGKNQHPSEKFRTKRSEAAAISSSSSARFTTDYKVLHNAARKFREEFESEMERFLRNNKGPKDMFHDSIAQAKNRVQATKSESEKFDIVRELIQSADRVHGLSKEKLLLFSDLIVTPLCILHTLHEYLNMFVCFVHGTSPVHLRAFLDTFKSASEFGSLSLDDPEGKKPSSFVSKYADFLATLYPDAARDKLVCMAGCATKYFQDGDTRTIIKGECGAKSDYRAKDIRAQKSWESINKDAFIRWGIDRQSYMIDLINNIFAVGSDYNKLARVGVAVGEAPTVDVSGLIDFSTKLISQMKQTIGRFKGNFSSSFIAKYESESVGSIAWIETNLVGILFGGKDMCGISRTTETLIKTWAWLNKSWNFDASNPRAPVEGKEECRDTFDDAFARLVYWGYKFDDRTAANISTDTYNRFPYTYLPRFRSGNIEPVLPIEKSLDKAILAGQITEDYLAYITEKNQIDFSRVSTFGSDLLSLSGALSIATGMAKVRDVIGRVGLPILQGTMLLATAGSNIDNSSESIGLVPYKTMYDLIATRNIKSVLSYVMDEKDNSRIVKAGINFFAGLPVQTSSNIAPDIAYSICKELVSKNFNQIVLDKSGQIDTEKTAAKIAVNGVGVSEQQLVQAANEVVKIDVSRDELEKFKAKIRPNLVPIATNSAELINAGDPYYILIGHQVVDLKEVVDDDNLFLANIPETTLAFMSHANKYVEIKKSRYGDDKKDGDNSPGLTYKALRIVLTLASVPFVSNLFSGNIYFVSLAPICAELAYLLGRKPSTAVIAKFADLKKRIEKIIDDYNKKNAENEEKKSRREFMTQEEAKMLYIRNRPDFYMLDDASPSDWNSVCGRGLLVSYNEVVARYIAGLADGMGGKVYVKLLETFASSANSKEIIQAAGVKDLNYSIKYVTGIHNGSSVKYDPPESTTLFATIGKSIRMILTAQRNEKKIFAFQDLSEVPHHVRENYKANLPLFVKELNLITQKAEMMVRVLGNINVQRVVPESFVSRINASDNIKEIDPVTDVHGGMKRVESESHFDRVNYYRGLLTSIATGAVALANCANHVLKELNDVPQFMQTSDNMFAEYKARNGTMPLTPLSTLAYFVNTSSTSFTEIADSKTGKRIKDTCGLYPCFVIGSAQFKLLYGTRYVLGSTGTVTLDQLPGVKAIVEKTNNYDKLGITDASVEAYANNLFHVTRYLTDILYHKKIVGGMIGCNNTFTSDSTEVCPVQYNMKATQVVNIIDTNDQKFALKMMGECLTGDEPTGKYGSRTEALISNIIGLGITPINVHAMNRDIPLVNLVNYAYTMERIVMNRLMPEYKLTPGSLVLSETYEPTNARERLAKMLIYPNARCSNFEYFKLTNEVYSGSIDVSQLERPRYLSNELWNKVLLNSLYPYGSDHRDPLGSLSAKQAVLDYKDKSRSWIPIPMLFSAQRYFHSDPNPMSKELVYVVPSKGVSSLPEKKSVVLPSTTVVEELNRLGKIRYDTALIRKLEFLVNAQRLLRDIVSGMIKNHVPPRPVMRGSEVDEGLTELRGEYRGEEYLD